VRARLSPKNNIFPVFSPSYKQDLTSAYTVAPDKRSDDPGFVPFDKPSAEMPDLSPA